MVFIQQKICNNVRDLIKCKCIKKTTIKPNKIYNLCARCRRIKKPGSLAKCQCKLENVFQCD